MQFDIEKFDKALEFFRTSFVEHWEDEKRMEFRSRRGIV